jgi:hypothetical protein
MSKHALLLASEEWCKAASSSRRIKVYDFMLRKRGIHALKPGSVCVVMTKAKPGRPQMIYGEFTVVEVKEVDSSEYDRLAREGYIYNPQTLKPGEKRWVIFFDEFKEYPKKVPKGELKDVKTSTSKKPISEWPILGTSYIDQQALDAIRMVAEFAQPSFLSRINIIENSLKRVLESANLSFSVTHECVELMLLRIGKQLGFHTYTADPSRTCDNISLKELADMDRDYLKRYAGDQFLDSLSRVDVIWHRSGEAFYVFEIVIGGNMKEALVRLLSVIELNAKMFVVATEDREREYRELIKMPGLNIIMGRCDFISIPQLIKMYVLTNLWRESVDKLKLPFVGK